MRNLALFTLAICAVSGSIFFAFILRNREAYASESIYQEQFDSAMRCLSNRSALLAECRSNRDLGYKQYSELLSSYVQQNNNLSRSNLALELKCSELDRQSSIYWSTATNLGAMYRQAMARIAKGNALFDQLLSGERIQSQLRAQIEEDRREEMQERSAEALESIANDSQLRFLMGK